MTLPRKKAGSLLIVTEVKNCPSCTKHNKLPQVRVNFDSSLITRQIKFSFKQFCSAIDFWYT